MTIPPAERSAARSLAAVSGAPYQSCLLAVRVLSPLAARVNLGDLAPIVNDVRGPRVIGLRVDATDISQLETLFDKCAPADDDAFAAEGLYNETRFVIPIALGGHRLYYDMALDGHLWPGGVWRFPATSVPDAVRITQAEDREVPAMGRRILVCAKPAEATLLPPDPVGSWSIPECMIVGEPTGRGQGPGFCWGHFSFADLGLGTGPVRTNEQGEAISDPPVGTSGGGLSFPEPLLECYRALVPADARHVHVIADDPQAYVPRRRRFPMVGGALSFPPVHDCGSPSPTRREARAGSH